MPPEEIATTRLAAPLTRRSVVRRGAKLAYAAPLVAASIALSSVDNEALAVSPAQCEHQHTEGDCRWEGNRCEGKTNCRTADGTVQNNDCAIRVEGNVCICGCARGTTPA